MSSNGFKNKGGKVSLQSTPSSPHSSSFPVLGLCQWTSPVECSAECGVYLSSLESSLGFRSSTVIDITAPRDWATGACRIQCPFIAQTSCCLGTDFLFLFHVGHDWACWCPLFLIVLQARLSPYRFKHNVTFKREIIKFIWILCTLH
jgi:hypothetical protein